MRGEIIPILNSPYEIENNTVNSTKTNNQDVRSIIIINIDENMIGLIADATEEVGVRVLI